MSCAQAGDGEQVAEVCKASWAVAVRCSSPSEAHSHSFGGVVDLSFCLLTAPSLTPTSTTQECQDAAQDPGRRLLQGGG
ncbi:hypothetical protein ABBQ38_011785 [Trebouxia sp. C0009 RCD-2024]